MNRRLCRAFLWANSNDTGDDTSGGGGEQQQQVEQQNVNSDKGFPEGTPIAEMTDAQQAAYWKHQSRKHEQSAKDRSDYDAMKAKAAEYDKYVESQKTEQERAVEAARAEGAATARAQANTDMAAAMFRLALTPRLSPQDNKEKFDLAVRGFNPAGFIGEDGAIDTDAIGQYAQSFGAPEVRRGDVGQGNRGAGNPSGKPTSVAEAREQYRAQNTKN